MGARHHRGAARDARQRDRISRRQGRPELLPGLARDGDLGRLFHFRFRHATARLDLQSPRGNNRVSTCGAERRAAHLHRGAHAVPREPDRDDGVLPAGLVLLRLHLRAVEHACAAPRLLRARSRALFREEPADHLPRGRYRFGARAEHSYSQLYERRRDGADLAQLENEARLEMPPKLIALIIKELLSAFHDPRTRIAFIVPPIMQVFLYAYAATLEVTNAPIGVYNEDWGQSSRQLISRFEKASAFSTITYFKSEKEIQPAIDSQGVLAVVRIPQDFSRKIAAREPVSVQVLLDGRKSNSAQILNSYINAIVANYAVDVVLGEERPDVSAVLDRSWFNPNREYRNTMVPSLVGTLTMTTVLMVMVMSVSRERELGTFEQLLVSPLQPLEIVIGKAVPGLIVGLAQAVVISLLVTQLFGIRLSGSAPVLFLGLTVFLIAVIGVALFVSSLVSNQQQAMMGIMVVMM